MRRFAFKPNTLPGVFTFFVGEWNTAEAVEHLKFQGIIDTNNTVADTSLDGCCARCYYPEEGYPLIWLSEPPHTPLDIGSMVHELEHALMYHLNWLGIEHGGKTTEVYAYMMDRLTTGVLELIWHDKLCDGFIHF